MNKPNDEQEVVDYAAVLGEAEDTALAFYYHYAAQDWKTPQGAIITDWRMKFRGWRVQERTMRARSEMMYKDKIAFWKQQQHRREAERIAERQQRAKEHNPAQRGGGAVVTVTINGKQCFPYTWYLEQVQVFGPKVNDRIDQVKDETGKAWWCYK